MKSIATKALGVLLSAFFIFAIQAETERCFSHDTAHITGNMNIREGPSTSNSKVGLATAGQSFEVLNAEQGDLYCWIQIDTGWIAKTGRVNGSTSDSQPVTASVSAIPITGTGWALRKLENAIGYLKEESQTWYSYVAEVVKRIDIVSGLKLRGKEVAAIAHFPAQTVSIHTRQITTSPRSVLISTLVHEACHLHQGIQMRKDWEILTWNENVME